MSLFETIMKMFQGNPSTAPNAVESMNNRSEDSVDEAAKTADNERQLTLGNDGSDGDGE